MFGSVFPSPAPSYKASQNTFDMFGSSSSIQQKPKQSNDVFDPFAGMQQQQKPQPQQQQKPQQKLLGAGPSQQNQGSKGSDVFDMLGF
ncbi:hypothetical protein TVAG_486760 [Trichomonas vaginalis G3]|uniref:Uncharacterized protein n=1 Tax=Trichomonas vaginalis (strain ATCC PRA-98 / G3) TaxID=412133 RepID=A2DZA4_TRIV3|nr:hypothetical protein TVAGG3_1017450 [Trichomonas vaginalis G3]EAY14233.1 hypothetical protein TVAG_486760 [Trichomonas vaginalis G3]KAI5491909.1 hypothetical protein TVAGG3_1017450 [Trichomonas vaginalis G3]|eukprot:XP_001326456.1 hypothetical protein [Trichomonas vaginalis G3]